MPAIIETMMYVNEVPWHGLGIQLNRPPTIREAIEQSGLDWDVGTYPLFYEAHGVMNKVKGAKIVKRETDNRELGIVGPNWTPLQNREAFRFFQPFVDSGEVALETAGALRGGKHIWVLAQIQRDPVDVVKDDPVQGYLLLANGHDGKLSVSVAFTPIRVVCANTLALALEEEGSKILRVFHHKNVVQAVDKVRETVDAVNQKFVATSEQYKELARHQISENDLKAYVTEVFIDRKKQRELNAKLSEIGIKAYDDVVPKRVFDKIQPLFETGAGNDLPGVRGTYWAAYNAVTEYLNHSRGKSQDTRIDSLWFGENAATNKKAFNKALEMAVA